MRSWRILLTLLLVLSGCQGGGFGAKVDNPVVGPPPPRRTGASNGVAPRQYAANDVSDNEPERNVDTDISHAEFRNDDAGSQPELDGNRVVATVNGAPIFEAEILERYAEDLAKFRAVAPPEKYRQQTEQLIQRDLRGHVERKLMSEAMHKTLKKDQEKQFDGFMKRAFQEQCEKMKTDFGVTSTAELDRELQKHGTSLAMVEHQFRNKTLAQQYMASRVKNNTKLSRQDLFAYYQQHLKDYEVKSRVKWQQILISRGDEEQAQAKLKIMVDGVKAGRDFGDLAAEVSDGPTADNKGAYDWTNKGSLADQRIDKALFKLPIGEVSQIFESPTNFQIVRVLERQKSGHVPFDEVQDKIRNQLQETDQQGEVTAALDELWRTATIDSPYKIQGYPLPDRN